MSKRSLGKMALLAVLAVVVRGDSCALEERVIDIVITDRTCVTFSENHQSEDFDTEALVNYSDEIGAILEDHGVSRSEIESAHVVSASYEVTSFKQDHDWEISGSVTVERVDIADSSATLIDYTSESVQALLHNETSADLTPKGVSLLNDALDDFVAGENPKLLFTVENAQVVPPPDAGDPIVFTWRACVTLHVVFVETADVPKMP
jgi:hypothetical protein